MLVEPGIALLMGACVGVGLFVLLRVGERWSSRDNIPREFARWHDELELRALQAIQADLHAAESRARLVSLIGQIPQDFDPTALLAVNVAAGVHRAALEHAERQGIIRAGSFEKVYGEKPGFQKTSAALSSLEELEPVIVETSPETSEKPPARPRWQNGRLVVR